MNRARLIAVLFPPVPRDFPGRRALRTTLRALHILTAGTLLGGHIFAQPPELLFPWLVAAIVTGLLLMSTDLHASFAVLCEARGVAMVVKIILLGLVVLWPGGTVPVLVVVLFIGAVTSHLPKTQRHRLVFLLSGIVSDHRRG